MNHSRSQMNRHKNNSRKNKDLEYRRDEIISLYSRGRNHSEIAKILHVSRPAVTLDLHYRMQKTKEKAGTFLEETLTFENEVCRVGLNKVLEKVWDIIIDSRSSEKSVLQMEPSDYALSQAKF